MDIIEFIVGRYNYWIFITLMMIGLYIVISRGNLVKTIVGLNLFQTSVFIFYISIGKIVGGTAPIIVGSYKAKDSHGEGYGEGSHGADSHGDDYETSGASENLHDTDGLDVPSNSLSADVPAGDTAAGTDSLHQMPETAADLASGAGAAYDSVADAAAQGAEVIYTNPLPHVLILTAIVVGVATTAVGLALAVRIREAYGTIEEDELEAADHFAEFGVPLHADTKRNSKAEGSQTQEGAA